ncbi:hypothetical protein CCUS01_01726 [Colletotrichum cuscutae]|uniref:Uncharacterized protein n=1 Tax=Colletotrichum cuscutae TaxID=1209917 RepID=A0AAI9XP13_9PEZI|nr:hypothetical protein CCUS01_01726 [Colletotrichum cuscutae]
MRNEPGITFSLQAQRIEETPTDSTPCTWMGWVTCAACWVVGFGDRGIRCTVSNVKYLDKAPIDGDGEHPMPFAGLAFGEDSRLFCSSCKVQDGPGIDRYLWVHKNFAEQDEMVIVRVPPGVVVVRASSQDAAPSQDQALGWDRMSILVLLCTPASRADTYMYGYLASKPRPPTSCAHGRDDWLSRVKWSISGRPLRHPQPMYYVPPEPQAGGPTAAMPGSWIPSHDVGPFAAASP